MVPAPRSRAMSGFRIVVLASGSGTNLQAILDQLHGRDGIEVVGVGSDKPGARALERAAAAGVETAVFPADAYEDRAARDAAMGDWIESPRRRPRRPRRLHAAAERTVRRPLPQPDRQRPPRPAAGLPRARRDRPGAGGGGQTTGVTVHFVDEGIDTGPAILPARGRRCRPGATGRGWKPQFTRLSTSSIRRRSAWGSLRIGDTAGIVL